MAPAGTLTDYERQRLENIRRNDEMMAALLLRTKAADLSDSAKRLKSKTPDSGDKRIKKKHRSSPLETCSLVVRRSLRNQGLPPDLQPDQLPPPDLKYLRPPPLDRNNGPLLISEASSSGSDYFDRQLLDTILKASSVKQEPDFVKSEGGELFDPLRDLVLRPENVRKVANDRIFAVQVLPLSDRRVVVAGDKLGHVGFWDVDNAEGHGVELYSPHSAPVSGISAHAFSPAQIYTCSYDGFIRLMDIQNGTFNMIYKTENQILSIRQSLDNDKVIYFGEGTGELKLWDGRIGGVSSIWNLHENRINTVDIHPKNTHLMATSSTDGLACLWDLRNVKKEKAEKLKIVQHDRAVHSAYFSPAGSYLATTSIDNKVGLLTGVDFDDLSMIKHDNQTGRWLSTFRAIWGWDESYLIIGNMRRAVDVISTAEKTTTAMDSEHMTSIPCRFAAHPCIIGSLAGATAGGKIYLWEKS